MVLCQCPRSHTLLLCSSVAKIGVSKWSLIYKYYLNNKYSVLTLYFQNCSNSLYSSNQNLKACLFIPSLPDQKSTGQFQSEL